MSVRQRRSILLLGSRNRDGFGSRNYPGAAISSESDVPWGNLVHDMWSMRIGSCIRVRQYHRVWNFRYARMSNGSEVWMVDMKQLASRCLRFSNDRQHRQQKIRFEIRGQNNRHQRARREEASHFPVLTLGKYSQKYLDSVVKVLAVTAYTVRV